MKKHIDIRVDFEEFNFMTKLDFKQPANDSW